MQGEGRGQRHGRASSVSAGVCGGAIPSIAGALEESARTDPWTVENHGVDAAEKLTWGASGEGFWGGNCACRGNGQAV